MLRYSVHSTFSAFISERIAKAYASRRAFIRAAEGKDREDSGQGYLGQVIAGRRPPPPDRLDAWAKALSLTEAERDQFFRLACIAHVHPSMRPRLEKLLFKTDGRDGRSR